MRNAAKVRFRMIVLWSGLVLAVFLPSVGGAIPQEMNYQGYLTDAQGAPITGTILMTFRIYDSLSSWTKLWQENQNVQVASGVYNVTLGTITPITLPFDIPYYLGVSIQSDPEMTPRYPLTSVGYAFRAQVADAVAGSATYSSPIVSTVTTGTAPLQVTSTTNVTNLNSDLLDGKHASDFGTASQITNLQTQVTSLQTQVSTLQTQVTNLLTLFSNFTRSGNNIYVTGANLHIRSGSGATDGAVNGTGNLIIGYNEMVSGQTKSGSHNLVVGKENDYSSYGGIVAGQRNVISATYATVAGGYGNTASGNNAAVAGGNTNIASASSATVTGGYNNEASAVYSSVSGGAYNVVAGGFYGSVSGGENNSVTNHFASVSGGRYNVASARWSHVSGGGGGGAAAGNEAYSEYSAILGGGQNTTGDPASGDRTIGSWSTVSGGIHGNATANWASVVGGDSNTASGVYSAVLGGQNNTASGFYSSVGGGYQNVASGSSSTVGGGYTNTAGTTYATVSGALPQYDSGWVSIARGGAVDLTHNLGGDPDDYIVDLQFSGSGVGRNIYGYGGEYADDNQTGAWWLMLGSTSIRVARGTNDYDAEQIRLRIWVNKKL